MNLTFWYLHTPWNSLKNTTATRKFYLCLWIIRSRNKATCSSSERTLIFSVGLCCIIKYSQGIIEMEIYLECLLHPFSYFWQYHMNLEMWFFNSLFLPTCEQVNQSILIFLKQTLKCHGKSGVIYIFTSFFPFAQKIIIKKINNSLCILILLSQSPFWEIFKLKVLMRKLQSVFGVDTQLISYIIELNFYGLSETLK